MSEELNYKRLWIETNTLLESFKLKFKKMTEELNTSKAELSALRRIPRISSLGDGRQDTQQLSVNPDDWFDSPEANRAANLILADYQLNPSRPRR